MENIYNKNKIMEDGGGFMNTYFSFLGRLLEERTPIYQEGYFIMYEENQAGYSLDKPEGIEVVTEDSFLNALVEGSKEVIQAFANRQENNDVYVFNLYSDEFNSFYIYMNTIKCFKLTLHKYQTEYPKYHEINYANSLKYNQGDFDFQFWPDDMGDYGRIIEQLETLGNSIKYLESDELIALDSNPIFAFEAGIIKSGYHVLALKAVLRLISENAFDSLNKTDNFIAYASSGHEDIDYGIVMRKSINQSLFYSLFPDIKEKDLQFEESMKLNQHLSVGEFIDYFSEAILDEYAQVTPFTFFKPQMEIFLQLEHFGNELAQECIERLNEMVGFESLERDDYKRIYFYVEALHYAGQLTEEQLEQCCLIARLMNEKSPTLKETSQVLINVAS